MEPSRGNSHDRHWIVVDENLLPQDPAIPLKALHPIVMAKNNGGVTFVHPVVFFGREYATEGSSHGKRLEVISRDQFGLTRSVAPSKVTESGVEYRQKTWLKALRLLREVLVHRIGSGARSVVVSQVRAGRPDHDKFFRVLYRQQTQKQLVQKREDRGIGADTQGQGKNGDGGEHRGAQKRPCGVLQI